MKQSPWGARQIPAICCLPRPGRSVLGPQRTSSEVEHLHFPPRGAARPPLLQLPITCSVKPWQLVLEDEKILLNTQCSNSIKRVGASQ